jgi:pSer/pThr/pTyr-binding forkhead associated (FHA) protein
VLAPADGRFRKMGLPVVGRLAATSLFLAGVAGLSKGFVVDVESAVFVVGRLPSSNLVLPAADALASRVHARIETNASGHFIIDQNSTNGTYVNDVLLPPSVPHRLCNGDKVRIGASTFEVHISTGTVPVSGHRTPGKVGRVGASTRLPDLVTAVVPALGNVSIAGAGGNHREQRRSSRRFLWAMVAGVTLLSMTAILLRFLPARALVVRQVIEPSTGGQVSLSDGALVMVPPDALTAPATLTLERVDHLTAIVAANPFTKGSPIYDIRILGRGTIGNQVTIILPRESSDADVGAYYWDSESWVYAGGRVVGDFVECSTRHLSLWTTGPALGDVRVEGYSAQTYGFRFSNEASEMQDSPAWQDEPLARGGICAGMSSASVALFEQSRVVPSAGRFSDLSTTWQEYLIGEHVANTRMDPWSAVAWSLAETLAAGMSTEVAKLREQLAEGQPVFLRLRVNDPRGAYGHAVVAYDWRKIDGLRWVVTCYDPNNATAPVELAIIGYDDMSGRVTFSMTYGGLETYFIPEAHPAFFTPLPDDPVALEGTAAGLR